MDLQKLTKKSLDAVKEAKSLAGENGNSQLEQEHLLLALISQQDGLIGSLLTKLNIDKNAFRNTVKDQIRRFPKVSGAQDNDSVYVSRELNDSFKAAEDAARRDRGRRHAVEGDLHRPGLAGRHLALDRIRGREGRPVRAEDGLLAPVERIRPQRRRVEALRIGGVAAAEPDPDRAIGRAVVAHAHRPHHAVGLEVEPLLGRDEEDAAPVRDVLRVHRERLAVRPLEFPEDVALARSGLPDAARLADGRDAGGAALEVVREPHLGRPVGVDRDADVVGERVGVGHGMPGDARGLGAPEHAHRAGPVGPHDVDRVREHPRELARTRVVAPPFEDERRTRPLGGGRRRPLLGAPERIGVEHADLVHGPVGEDLVGRARRRHAERHELPDVGRAEAHVLAHLHGTRAVGPDGDGRRGDCDSQRRSHSNPTFTLKNMLTRSAGNSTFPEAGNG